MEENIQVKYDSICYITLMNIKSLTDKVDYIVLKNFDHKNKEHLFIMAVINACYGVLGNKKVLINKNIVIRKHLANKNKAVGKILHSSGKELVQVDVQDLLELMRGYSCGLCGEGFTFGEIFDAYYGGKD